MRSLRPAPRTHRSDGVGHALPARLRPWARGGSGISTARSRRCRTARSRQKSCPTVTAATSGVRPEAPRRRFTQVRWRPSPSRSKTMAGKRTCGPLPSSRMLRVRGVRLRRGAVVHDPIDPMGGSSSTSSRLSPSSRPTSSGCGPARVWRSYVRPVAKRGLDLGTCRTSPSARGRRSSISWCIFSRCQSGGIGRLRSVPLSDLGPDRKR